ncbi:protoporphyrinogen oxidase [Candidatus Parabeggiatoa sp. HSG14]|uniref:protoporphyrinogen oxidase n=1 Tax=Candidatus Parabeggiatoa sp. HSG14 TaxID=3055593 RepID=UPI0025A6AA5B|nr:protoporphyrinogen oxidase [Thiotrichales bacterium HSG14]
MTDIDVLIVGGGISGLSIAWWLAQAGISVEVWEQETRPGGKIQSVKADGYLTEQAASIVMNFRPEVSQFMIASGLEAYKMPRADTTNRYLVHDGQLLSLPMKLMPMIMSPLWSLRGKLRMFTEPFIPKGGHAQETVTEFITRRLGSEVLEKAMGSYITGTLASDPDLANAYAVLPRLTALEQRYGSIALGVLINKVLRRRTAAITEAFSFQGGMKTLIESLAQGIRFRPKHAVTKLEREGNNWRITSTNNRSVLAQQVVLSTPANVAASLVKPLDNQLAKYLAGIKIAPLSVVHLGFPRAAIPHALDGTGFLTPRQEDFAVTGCLWMSSLFSDRAPQGKVLLSTYIGGATQPAAVDWDDERSITAVMEALQSLLGINCDPENVRIDRHYQGLPLYHGNHTGRIAEIAKHLVHLPGLHLEANYREGISVRDRIARAAKVAEQILAYRKL